MMMNYVKARILFIYFIFYNIKIRRMLTQKKPVPFVFQNAPTNYFNYLNYIHRIKLTKVKPLPKHTKLLS